jgi:hypothetical protein
VLGRNVGAACADPQAEALEVNVADVVEVHRFESPGISSTFGDPGNQVTALMLSMLCWRT